MLSGNLLRLLEYTRKMSCEAVTFDVAIYGSAINKDPRVSVVCLPQEGLVEELKMNGQGHYPIDGEYSVIELVIDWIADQHKQHTKPKVIYVNDIVIPNIALTEEPSHGTQYIVPNLTSVIGISYPVWGDHSCDKRSLALGIAYPDTEEGKAAAKLRCEAMLITNQ